MCEVSAVHESRICFIASGNVIGHLIAVIPANARDLPNNDARNNLRGSLALLGDDREHRLSLVIVQ